MNINIVIGIFFVFIIPAVCLSLLIRVLYLQNILSQKKKARAYFETKREEAGNARKYAKSEISRAPSNFYSAKSSCMTKNESLMFYYLNTALTDLIPNPWERKNYYVFPQVSLYSLVRIRDELKTRSQTRAIVENSYISKSIDFVICHCYKVGNMYQYKPVLLIELDGLSHSPYSPYGKEAVKRQMENDAFKDSLFKDLNIPFSRFTLKANLNRSDLPEIYKMLREHLIIPNNLPS